MKQLLVLSGKGGTGKTTLVASFIQLSKAKVYADCDVDAPNLHLIMNQEDEPMTEAYYGMKKAEINDEACKNCGLCEINCRFDAISFNESLSAYTVDPYSCEGCGVCSYLCDAISMKEAIDGHTYLYNQQAIFSTAKLKMGSGTSGKLVSTVKSNMNNEAEMLNSSLAILDGSPGIGCPVIASVSGVDMVLIVTEPTLSGISDMKRVAEVGAFFNVPLTICVNKYDINQQLTNTIKSYAKDMGYAFVGTIPYDSQIVSLNNQGLTPIDETIKATEYIRNVYKKTMIEIKKEIL